MKHLRFLAFEYSKTCNMAHVHPKCPVSDPERYLFGNTDRTLDDDTVVEVVRWARSRGFEGVVRWNLYNEPSMANTELQALMARIREEFPSQRFLLLTNSPQQFISYDIVRHTNYKYVKPDDLDDRMRSAKGEGNYDDPHVARTGACTRDENWEVVIDHHGNWLLCCNDWRCEDSVGNIFLEPLDLLHERFLAKHPIAWGDRGSFEALPRMCRSCITVNPMLHQTAIPFGGV